MSAMTSCEKCGARLPATGRISGLCPRCLMRVGIESERAGPRSWEPPTLAELSAEFPLLELISLIGRGGMGAVYKARQTGLDRLVALKILPDEVGEDPAFAERFEREARVLAQLDHPSIVRVHDAGRQGSRYYLLMEFVDGLNLRQLIRAGEVKPTDALSIVSQVCEALQYAHDKGVVHRDIKPENILVDAQGRVKIADFGLAKLVGLGAEAGLLTRSDQAMGTLHYMAPEQIRRPLSVDHRADIYSLGVVFYELLTGEVPVGAFPPPSATVAVDVRLDEVVLRSLAREPEQRYQRAGDVRTDVQSVSSGRAAAFAAGLAGADRAANGEPDGHEREPARRATRHGGGEDGAPRVHADHERRRKTPGWAWVLIGCLVVPFGLFLLVAVGFLFLAPKGPFNEGARIASLESQYGTPQPVELVPDRFAGLSRVVNLPTGSRPFESPVLEWRGAGPALVESVLESQGVDLQGRAQLERSVHEMWTDYLELERAAVRRIEPSGAELISRRGVFAGRTDYLLLELDAFAAERRALAERFRRGVEPYLGPSGWYAVGADRIAADLMLFGERRAFLALESGSERARIGVEDPGVRSEERTATALPLPLQRMFDAYREVPIAAPR